MRPTLIITTHRAVKPLESILKALQRQTQPDFDVIIAEDGQDVDTACLVETYRDRLALQHVSQPHIGMRKSRILNQAIRKTHGAYIIFLDGDCVPHSKFIADHISLACMGYFVQGRRAFIKEPSVPAFMEHASTGHFLKLFCRGQASGFFKGFRFPWPYIEKDTQLKGILGCNLAVWKQDLYAINGFDEAFEGWGREDTDVAVRLYRLGLKRLYVHGRSIVYHLNHPKQPLSTNNDQLLQKAAHTDGYKCLNGLEKA